MLTAFVWSLHSSSRKHQLLHPNFFRLCCNEKATFVHQNKFYKLRHSTNFMFAVIPNLSDFNFIIQIIFKNWAFWSAFGNLLLLVCRTLRHCSMVIQPMLFIQTNVISVIFQKLWLKIVLFFSWLYLHLHSNVLWALYKWYTESKLLNKTLWNLRNQQFSVLFELKTW